MPTSDRYWDAEAIKRVPSLNDWINLPLHWWGTKIVHERDHIARCQHVAKDLANKPNERQHMNRVMWKSACILNPNDRYGQRAFNISRRFSFIPVSMPSQGDSL